jgi:hypothetical protein
MAENTGNDEIVVAPPPQSTESKNPLRDKLLASDKTAEIFAAQVMAGVENVRYMDSRPGSFGLKPEQVGQIPTDAIGSWAFHHIGDVWEVAYLFTATRLAVAGVNEAFKKVTKKEIPDEACFWASMITSVAIPSMLELNMMPLFGKNLNSSPDYADLFGVGVGALVIIASHYASKNREGLKDFSKGALTKIAEKGKILLEKGKQVKEKVDRTLGITDDQLAKR